MSASGPAAPADARKPGFREALESLRHRDFALFWWSALVSSTGSWIQNVAVPYVLYRLTENAFWIGFAGFVQWIPGLLIGPLAGSLADRMSRRKILLVTQSMLAGCALGLWAIWAAGLARLPVLLAVVCLMGFLGGLNMPSWQAFVTDLVPRERLLNAVTLNSAQFNASRALGPAIGGVVLARFGPGAAFLLNALSYCAVIAALVAIKVPGRSGAKAAVAGGSPDEVGEKGPDLHKADRERPGVLADFAGTLRYVSTKPGIVSCLVLGASLGFFGMPVASLVIVFTEQVFHVGRAAYGFLGACLGIGSIIGTPLVAGRWSTARRGRITALTLPVYGLSIAAFGLAPHYLVAVVALIIGGAAYLGVAAALNTTVQLQVDELMRGKSISLYLMSLTASMPLGALLQGWLVEAIGPRPVVAVTGSVLVVIAVVMKFTGRMALLDATPATPATPASSLPAGSSAAHGSRDVAEREAVDELSEPVGPDAMSAPAAAVLDVDEVEAIEASATRSSGTTGVAGATRATPGEPRSDC